MLLFLPARRKNTGTVTWNHHRRALRQPRRPRSLQPHRRRQSLSVSPSAQACRNKSQMKCPISSQSAPGQLERHRRKYLYFHRFLRLQGFYRIKLQRASGMYFPEGRRKGKRPKPRRRRQQIPLLKIPVITIWRMTLRITW